MLTLFEALLTELKRQSRLTQLFHIIMTLFSSIIEMGKRNTVGVLIISKSSFWEYETPGNLKAGHVIVFTHPRYHVAKEQRKHSFYIFHERLNLRFLGITTIGIANRRNNLGVEWKLVMATVIIKHHQGQTCPIIPTCQNKIELYNTFSIH